MAPLWFQPYQAHQPPWFYSKYLSAKGILIGIWATSRVTCLFLFTCSVKSQIHHFHLIIDHCCLCSNLWLGGSENTQIMMGRQLRLHDNMMAVHCQMFRFPLRLKNRPTAVSKMENSCVQMVVEPCSKITEVSFLDQQRLLRELLSTTDTLNTISCCREAYTAAGTNWRPVPSPPHKASNFLSHLLYGLKQHTQERNVLSPESKQAN